jgi:hypothetical protein
MVVQRRSRRCRKEKKASGVSWQASVKKTGNIHSLQTVKFSFYLAMPGRLPLAL